MFRARTTQERGRTYPENGTIAEELKQIARPAEREVKLAPEQTAGIDMYIKKKMKQQQVPGIAVGVYRYGHILFAKGYGVGDLETRFPVEPETPFCIASMGKQFVSAAIMMLVEERRMSLEDSLAKYFPDSPKRWEQIRIKNLLSHTSGLSAYMDGRLIRPGGPFDRRLDYTEQELVDRTKALPILFKPGARWEYTNTNYMLLGAIIHEVTGKFYFDYLKERIFRPLHMSSPRLVLKNDTADGIPSGYELDRGHLSKAARWSDTFSSTADGGMYCNVLDLAKWDRALYGTRLLKRSSLERIWTVFRLNNGRPNPDNYGFGWQMDSADGYKSVEHGGTWNGFGTYIARYVDRGLTIAVLENRGGSYKAGRAAHAIADILKPELA